MIYIGVLLSFWLLFLLVILALSLKLGILFLTVLRSNLNIAQERVARRDDFNVKYSICFFRFASRR